jgi:regulator of protease activity HflC (stomatin/prohibitin superfamily)
MTIALVVILVAAVALLALAAASRRLARVTVYEFERGLRYDRGRFTRLLDPGQYLIYRRRTSIRKVDIRPAFVSVPGQEVLTADAVTLRVSIAAEYEIVDPAVAVNGVEDYRGSLYLTLQLALREIVGAAQIDELLEQRSTLGPALFEQAAGRVREFGLELRSADVKDIMFPGDLKRTFAQVVAARKEGLAALERARGETAALRNLANAARMMEGNPALMQLRLLQQIGGASGNTIVLGLPSSTTPLPIREGGGPAPPELPPEPE